MTMNIGDLVMTYKGVARVTEIPLDSPITGTKRGFFHTSDLHLLTVPEAFEIAGHAVPEGAKLIAPTETYNKWNICKPFDYYRDFLNDGWSDVHQCCTDDGSQYIDLRRTPVSDTWDALPQVVREKVEEAKVGRSYE